MLPGGVGETAIRNPDRLWCMFRLILSFLLALTVHASLALMVMLQVLLHPPEVAPLPVVDLHSLALDVVPSVQPAAAAAAEPDDGTTGSAWLPVKILPNEVYLGLSAQERKTFLRVVRQRISEIWQEMVPTDAGRSVILLALNARGRVEGTRIVHLQGDDGFGRFIKNLRARLEHCVFPVPEEKGGIRVECEFRVGE